MADLQGVTVVETNLRQASEMDTRSATKYIGIHHTAHRVNGVEVDADLSASEINEIHITQRNWSMIGYHFVIRKNGTIERGRPEDKVPAAVENHNTEHIHVHVCGTFTLVEPTKEQIDSLTKLLSALCTKYNIEPSRTTIKGHKEFSGHESNDCPGTNLFNKLDSIVENVKSGNVGTSSSSGNANTTATKVPNVMTAADIINKIYGPTAAPVAFGSSEKQIPASVMIAMALRYGGLDTAEFKAWNVFGIKYIESISSGKKVDPDLCSFSTCSDAFTKLVMYIKTTTQFEKGIDKLAPKLEDSTEKQKEEFMDEICPEFAKVNNLEKLDEYLADIKKLISDNKLYDWDKKEALEKKVDQEAMAKASGTMNNSPLNKLGGAQTVGVGFERKQTGDIVTLTRLPKGKTGPCEPVYPDLITVGDKVPQWVLDITTEIENAKALEALKEKPAAAQNALSDPEKAMLKEKIVAYEKEYNTFTDTQYKEWIATQEGLTLDTTIESINKCKEAYNKAIKEDEKEEKFFKEIYYGGNIVIKNKILELKEKQKEVASLRDKVANG